MFLRVYLRTQLKIVGKRRKKHVYTCNSNDKQKCKCNAPHIKPTFSRAHHARGPITNSGSLASGLRSPLATTGGTNSGTTAIAANVVMDERQMNALFLDLVRVSESYGLKFPREFALLLKQLLYFDRYTRLLAPNLNMLQDQRISIASNKRMRNRYKDNFN